MPIMGTSKNDTLRAEHGFDSLFGEGGDDLLHGTFGPDALHGGAGADTIYALEAQNVVNGGPGADSILSGDQDDFLFDDSGGATIDGAGGADYIITDFDMLGAVDLVFGRSGDDTVNTGAGNDSVFGGDGDDIIIFNGRAGDRAEFDGQWGDDFLATTAGGRVVWRGGDGFDTIVGGRDGDTIEGGAHDDLLAGLGGADVIEAGSGADTIYGGGWDGSDAAGDVIDAGAGDDVLFSGFGADTLTGGEGADFFYVIGHGGAAGGCELTFARFLDGVDAPETPYGACHDLILDFAAGDVLYAAEIRTSALAQSWGGEGAQAGGVALRPAPGGGTYVVWTFGAAGGVTQGLIVAELAGLTPGEIDLARIMI